MIEIKRKDIDERKEEIIRELEAGVPRARICARLKCKAETLTARLKAWGVNHLKNPGRRNIFNSESGNKKLCYRNASYYFNNEFQIRTHSLKIKLWRDGLKPLECEECAWSVMSEDGRLPLELHHVNGDSKDNRFENLQILCPSCHALKPNNSGCKNKSKDSLSNERRLVGQLYNAYLRQKKSG